MMVERRDIDSWDLSDKAQTASTYFQPKTFVRKRLQMTKSKENGGKREKPHGDTQ